MFTVQHKITDVVKVVKGDAFVFEAQEHVRGPLGMLNVTHLGLKGTVTCVGLDVTEIRFEKFGECKRMLLNECQSPVTPE